MVVDNRSNIKAFTPVILAKGTKTNQRGKFTISGTLGTDDYFFFKR